ncbi:MAG: hypothetical protein H6813_07670 [Phycisphaeraceae bacterium]|nr:hypothetical protein [Phycisphaeraceae bacterium]MCB9848374.1 hypothetical protein [Phycisphaeraceae bacterium]
MRLRSGIGALLALAAAMNSHAEPTTTVITHGLSLGSKGAWVQNMAEAVVANGPSGGSVYRYDGATGAWRYLPALSDGSTETIALIFNWVDESDGVSTGPNWGYAQAASDALVAALRDARYLDGTGPGDLASGRTLHLIGHSRGAVVMSEASMRLVAGGITVDHLTTLDPHPVNGINAGCLGVAGDDWDDADPQRWSRGDGCAEVTFLDNYYRFDGNGCDPNGQPVDGAFNVSLRDVLGDTAIFDNDLFGSCPLEHTKVHAFYHGTVDLGAANDGDGCDIDNGWYTTTGEPGCSSRACQGFFYSALGDGLSMRPAMGAGVEPDPFAVLCNGGFDIGSYAGWSYHGGGGSGAINGGGFLRLSSAGSSRTHNRFYLPAGAVSLDLSHRVGVASPDDELVVTVTALGTGMTTELDRFALGAVEGAFTPRSTPLPMNLGAGSYTLTVAIDGGVSGIEAQVDVDDLMIITPSIGCEECPTDLNGDGVTDTADLGLLLAAFGSMGAQADINGDGIVDTADLGILLGAFGDLCG